MENTLVLSRNPYWLPHEMWQYILHFLPESNGRPSLVCRQWHRWRNDARRGLRVLVDKRTNKVVYFPAVASRFRFLEKLEIVVVGKSYMLPIYRAGLFDATVYHWSRTLVELKIVYDDYTSDCHPFLVLDSLRALRKLFLQSGNSTARQPSRSIKLFSRQHMALRNVVLDKVSFSTMEHIQRFAVNLETLMLRDVFNVDSFVTFSINVSSIKTLVFHTDGFEHHLFRSDLTDLSCLNTLRLNIVSFEAFASVVPELIGQQLQHVILDVFTGDELPDILLPSHRGNEWSRLPCLTFVFREHRSRKVMDEIDIISKYFKLVRAFLRAKALNPASIQFAFSAQFKAIAHVLSVNKPRTIVDAADLADGQD